MVDQQKNRPYTTVILAMSADGKIADLKRSPARFSSPTDKIHLEQQIAASDAVLFGAGTLRAYSTTLRVSTTQLLEQRKQRSLPPQPLQIVASQQGNIDRQLQFFRQPVPRWLLTTSVGAKHWQKRSEFERILVCDGDLGAEGQTREQGEQGMQGEQGETREQGRQGMQGEQGETRGQGDKVTRGQGEKSKIRLGKLGEEKLLGGYSRQQTSGTETDTATRGATTEGTSATHPLNFPQNLKSKIQNLKSKIQNPPATSIDWKAALQQLDDLGVKRLAVLGGGQLVASMLADDLIDEFWLTVCPLILGGSSSPTPVEGIGWDEKVAPRLELLSVEAYDQEVFLHYRLQRQPRED